MKLKIKIHGSEQNKNFSLPLKWVATIKDLMDGPKMDSQNHKDNTTAELVHPMLQEEKLQKELTDACSILNLKYLELMLKLPLDNGNTKLVQPKEWKSETICGQLDILFQEQVKNLMQIQIFTLNLSQVTGTAQDAILIFPQLRQENKEDQTTL